MKRHFSSGGWLVRGSGAFVIVAMCGMLATACGSTSSSLANEAAEAPAPVAAESSPVSTPPAPEEAPEDVARDQETPASPNAGSAGRSEEPPKPAKPSDRFNEKRIHQLKDLEVVKIKIGEHEFDAWVMNTESKMMEGMMHVADADFTEKQAMIFAYPEPQELGFWMRNTIVDLDIAFVSRNKRILNTTTMRALDETIVRSTGLAQYAIEFKAGTLRKKGIRAGMTVQIPDSVRYRPE